MPGLFGGGGGGGGLWEIGREVLWAGLRVGLPPWDSSSGLCQWETIMVTAEAGYGSCSFISEACLQKEAGGWLSFPVS